MNDLILLFKEKNVHIDIYGDIIVVHTKDAEYRLYDKQDNGLYSGRVKLLYATGEIFCKDIDMIKIIEDDILVHD